MNTWPEGIQSAVTITVNFDGESFEQPGFPDQPLWGRNSYGRYGAQEGIYRLLDLFSRHAVTATFFIPGWDVEHYPDAMDTIAAGGHDVAGRGWANENFARLEPDEQHEVLERSEQAFVRQFGAKPIGWRGPYGLPGYNDPGQRIAIPGSLVSGATRGILAERGYLYDSSYCDDDIPYPVPGTRLVELPVQPNAGDRGYYEGHRLPAVVGAAWVEELSATHQAGGLFNLNLSPRGDWGSGRKVRLSAVESVLQAIHETPNLWLATCREIAEWVVAGDR